MAVKVGRSARIRASAQFVSIRVCQRTQTERKSFCVPDRSKSVRGAISWRIRSIAVFVCREVGVCTEIEMSNFCVRMDGRSMNIRL